MMLFIFLLLLTKISYAAEASLPLQIENAVKRLKATDSAEEFFKQTNFEFFEEDGQFACVVAEALKNREQGFKDKVLSNCFVQSYNPYYFKEQMLGCIQAGANPNLVVKNGCAFNVAPNDYNFIKTLLEYNADPNLMTCCNQGEIEPSFMDISNIAVAQLALSHGVRVNAVTGFNQDTILHKLATKCSLSSQLLALYLSHNADVHQKNRYWQTPLDALVFEHALTRGSTNPNVYEAQVKEKIALFLSYGANYETTLAKLEQHDTDMHFQKNCKERHERMMCLLEEQVAAFQEAERLRRIDY